MVLGRIRAESLARKQCVNHSDFWLTFYLYVKSDAGNQTLVGGISFAL